jgi:ribonucleotide reductase beta subunit family protein with ferritin-like domain
MQQQQQHSNTQTRLTLFPIQDHEVWGMYQRAMASFWTVAEVDLTHDVQDWVNLTENERTFIKHVLAFFSSSDTIVNINLAERFLNDVDLLEAKYFYTFQMAIENVHSEMYSLLIDTYIKDGEERNKLLNAVEVIPVVHDKARWCFDWIEDDTATFQQRLIAFAIVEGVFFSGAFASIYWLKERGTMPGLGFSNELISRDEALHVEFAVLMYNKTDPRLRVAQDTVHAMFKDAVRLEKSFIIDSMKCSMLGMNAVLMGTYIEFVADRLLVQMGYAKLFHAANPFPFMDRIGIQNRTNFFEARVAEYSKANVGGGKSSSAMQHEFALDSEF